MDKSFIYLLKGNCTALRTYKHVYNDYCEIHLLKMTLKIYSLYICKQYNLN